MRIRVVDFGVHRRCRHREVVMMGIGSGDPEIEGDGERDWSAW